MRKKQRLVICLDGTWNNRDDSTNVIHHFALAIERPWPDAAAECTQTRYYGEGVGTGVLEGITGGAFGFGLEEDVRAAYDWLVERVHDADDSVDADEIYIFGFSRGAYTARSLVGFIGTFGLLRRGAALSVKQLWREYCLLGRERDHRSTHWHKIFGKDLVNTRRINDLIVDPWNVERFEGRRCDMSMPLVPDRVPGQLVDDLNPAERLLVRWSRRVRITYLGLYDTVGAIGLDALAIPGLKSRLAMHHNLHTTTLVQQCRHALAVDEHRGSFRHTPLVEFTGHGEEEDPQSRAMKEEATATYWKRNHAMWRRKIEQRWFAGAHSNIGGGYPDNELAQLPFKWLLEGAQQGGLECEGISLRTPAVMPKPRDSYSEFAKPFWSELIRSKRHYRQIDPGRQPFGPSQKIHGRNDHADHPPSAGFSLQSINETVDPTTLQWAASEAAYQPPNLREFARRKLRESPEHAEAATLQMIAARKPEHAWLGTRGARYAIAVLWATCAAVGFAAMKTLFTARWELPPLWLLSATALVFVLIDWGESRLNLFLAVKRRRPSWRAMFDTVYWTRTLGFVLFVIGAATALVRLWGLGWYAESFQAASLQAMQSLVRWGPAAGAAGAGVLLANGLDRAPKSRQISGVLGGVGGFMTVVGTVLIAILFGRWSGYVFTPAFGQPTKTVIAAATAAKFGGLLLLLQAGTGYFLYAFSWVGEPMRRANLGSIVALQRCVTPTAVSRRIEAWRRMLACHWDEADQDKKRGPAAKALREVLREALWRDLFGFIPLYTVVFLFGLWFAAEELGWQWLEQAVPYLPLWILLPLTAALADWAEDACHLRYLTLHERGESPPAVLTLFSFAMTFVKFLAFTVASVVVAAAILVGTYRVIDLEEETGWRGTLALLISTAAFLFGIAVVLGALTYRFRTWRQQRKPPEPPRTQRIHASQDVGQTRAKHMSRRELSTQPRNCSSRG